MIKQIDKDLSILTSADVEEFEFDEELDAYTEELGHLELEEQLAEILDRDLNLDTRETAKSQDIFDRWQSEEFDEEVHTPEGVYLGDNIYI